MIKNVSMTSANATAIAATSYDRSNCEVGVVHLGFGLFHRAHQAVYIDDYMDMTGDLRWGIAAVNLRESEADQFKSAEQDYHRHSGYYLKTYSPDGQVARKRVRSHVRFADWSVAQEECESLLSLPSVNLVTITVTESGYYTGSNGHLDLENPVINAEICSEGSSSLYAYLSKALRMRSETIARPLTIACCDNIRQNGKMLQCNLLAYLKACKQFELLNWVQHNVVFPSSMVDRITPRSPVELSTEFTELTGQKVVTPVMAEDFSQWVLQSAAAAEMPELEKVGVTVTTDVDPYEETKIRVLNGGHTCLAYLAALEGVETFDQAMGIPHLLEHFENFQNREVLPALTLELPFSKTDYLQKVMQRFGNASIVDTVERICADGMVKFPIFIRPTLEGCLKQGIVPIYTIRSIASWYVFALHVNAGKISFKYVEPGWKALQEMLNTEAFLVSEQLWGELPGRYPDFAKTLQREIVDMEQKWPV